MSASRGGRQILVIDDEPGFRDMYKFMLEPLGYGVDTAEGGTIGLQMMSVKTYDLILLDVRMPNMDGVEVLKRIKEIRPEQKVVIFSSNSDPAQNMEGMAKRLGVCGLLYKPMDLQEILNAINQSLSAPIAR